MPTEAHPIPEVQEAYTDYSPPFDVAAIIRDLLSYVPVEYLRGLKYVVLRNASVLSRRERRRKIPARGKTYPAHECRGFYRKPAHIVLHVDRIIQQAPGLTLRVSIFRDSIFAATLYHELGHHIHLVLHPQHREIENAADAWMEQLRRAFLQQKYHSLTREQWRRLDGIAAKLQQRWRRQRGFHNGQAGL